MNWSRRLNISIASSNICLILLAVSGFFRGQALEGSAKKRQGNRTPETGWKPRQRAANNKDQCIQCTFNFCYLFIEGSFEVKLPTIRTEKRREEERRSEKRKSQRKEDAGARKGRKVAKHCVFPMFCGSEGRKVGSLKRRVRSHLARREMEKKHPVREAHFEVKTYKAHQRWTAFESWDVEKGARRCGAKHIWEPKVLKTDGPGPLLEVEMSKKCTPVWREAHFEVNMLSTPHVRTTFGRSDVVSRGRRKGFCTCQKWAKREGFLACPKRWQAWDIWRGSGKMHFPWQARYKRHVHQRCWEVRALISWERLHFGASYLQVCEADFAWQVQHFVWLGITFSWQAQYFRQMEWKNCKTHWYEAVSRAFNFPFLRDVSQNSFAFGVVNFKNWGSLAELPRFWRC